ncbi:MAG: macro domain-containing protein [Bacillales bacterium]
MPLFVEKGDLVSKNVDCIVNASNVKLSMVEGVGRAIFHKAGDVELSNYCKKIGFCKPGDVVSSPSFNMTNTKELFHAVAPIYVNGKHDEENLLRKVYYKCLNMAIERGYNSIAFPLLSGEFNYPLNDCFDVAISVFKDFLKEHPDLSIYLVIYKNFPELLSEEEQLDLTKFIIENQAKTFELSQNKESFDVLIKRFIGRANIDINTLSHLSNLKIDYINNNIYHEGEVSKNTIFALGIALKLNLNEINDLMNSKGYTIESSVVSDLIVLYFVENNIYDIFKINSILFKYGYKSLGLIF